MATNRNIKEADDNDSPGWFYHAPARRKHEEPVGYPPMSQIPMLAEDGLQQDEPIRPLFRDTDTKYVRLAKQGGRANLLQMKENSDDKREPVYYPRNEWYYLEDNRVEDAQEKEQSDLEYAFMRPDYMVHQPNTREEEGRFGRPPRGPMGYDKLNVFEREGDGITDKTVKLPELRKTGYGIRSEKPLKIPKHLQQQKQPTSANTDPGRLGARPPRYLSMPDSETPEDKARISKILSYAYEREWQDQLMDWQGKQDIGREKHRNMTNVQPQHGDKVQSEYSMTYNKRSAAVHSNPREAEVMSHFSEGKGLKGVRQTETQRLREAKLRKPEEKEIFKMTRFKNIPARITTHRTVPQPAHAEPTAC